MRGCNRSVVVHSLSLSRSQPVPILYEDSHLLVVNKPPGMLSQSAASGDENLLDLLKQYLCQAKNKSRAFLGLVHRLDRNVSGVMVFGKTSKAASRVSEAFRGRYEVEKIYTAIVVGAISLGKNIEPILLNHLLLPGKERSLCFDAFDDVGLQQPSSGAQLAQLELTPLSHLNVESNISTFVKIRLLTGRKHQIRASLAYIGHPVIGDTLYGGNLKSPKPKALLGRKLMLHAYSLHLQHPTLGERMNFTASLPDHFPQKHDTEKMLEEN